jgi:hypothetical protein
MEQHLDALPKYAQQLFTHLQNRYTNDRRTARILMIWAPRSVERSPKRGVVEFNRRTLIIGPSCPTKDTSGKWLTRLIIAIAKASVDDSLCAGTTAWLLQIATNELGWSCEVDCDACYETGVCTKAECPKCEWKLENCAKNNKFVWPELVGRPAWLASLILKTLQPGKRVVMDPFDTLYQTPANPNVIRIVYDTKSGLVVTPAPYVTSSPEISGPREACFLAPEGLCLGAPPNPPPKEWDALVGEQLGASVLWLRARYPHAVVVPTPKNAMISRDLRHDRIRVRYDPKTLTVMATPTVG